MLLVVKSQVMIPVVDGDDLILGIYHLGVQSSNDSLLDNLGPLCSSQADRVLLHWLES